MYPHPWWVTHGYVPIKVILIHNYKIIGLITKKMKMEVGYLWPPKISGHSH
jgi:hypothetical protein